MATDTSLKTETPLSDALREQLIAHRRAAGMTGADVARSVGVSQSSISMYESRKQIGTVELVAEYAVAVGLRLSLVPANG